VSSHGGGTISSYGSDAGLSNMYIRVTMTHHQLLPTDRSIAPLEPLGGCGQVQPWPAFQVLLLLEPPFLSIGLEKKNRIEYSCIRTIYYKCFIGYQVSCQEAH